MYNKQEVYTHTWISLFTLASFPLLLYHNLLRKRMITCAVTLSPNVPAAFLILSLTEKNPSKLRAGIFSSLDFQPFEAPATFLNGKAACV